MGESKLIAGFLVLKAAPALDPNRYKVVICELANAEEGKNRYVVWYIDDQDRPTDGRFYKESEAAKSDFNRRT